MAVFNPMQGQVLISPVTNYYRGKAIRQELKSSELKNEALKFEVEHQDDRFQMEKNRDERAEREQNRLEKAAERQQEIFEMTVGEAKAKEYAEDLYSRIHATELVAAVAGDEAAQKYALENIAEYTQTLPKKFQANIKQVLADGKITPVELAQMKKRAALYLGITDPKSALKTHINYAKVTPEGTIDYTTIRSARPDTKYSDWLVDNGHVVVGTPPKGSGDGDGESDVDFEKAITSRMNSETFLDTTEGAFEEKLEDLNVKTRWFDNAPQKRDIIKRDFQKYWAIYETHNPLTPADEIRDSIFNMMFNVEHLGDGETKLHLREVQTMRQDGADFVKMPSSTGMRWYKVNTP